LAGAGTVESLQRVRRDLEDATAVLHRLAG
jgi:hypothetical protein